MAYCGPKGIPLSMFLAWPESDQEAALAWQLHDAQRCSGCGTHPAEWDEDEGGHRHAWVATAVQCPGCARIGAVARDETLQIKPGVHVVLTRPEVARRG